jgi:hypothetical protein
VGGAAVSFPLLRSLFNRCPSNNSEESGWVSLPLQDKRMGPWKRHKVTKKDGAVIMQWLGDLRRCGISDREFDMSVKSILQLELGRASA